MDSERLVLALDQGTSSTKASLFSCAGEEVASTSRQTVTSYPDLVGAVGDPDSWWDALVGCIRELLEDASVRSRVVGVAVCGFMHTLVPISEDGSVIASPILWSDQRGSAEDSTAPAISGPLQGSPAQLACRQHLVRLGRENSDLQDSTAKLLPVKDYLRWRLTGDAATDAYEASGTGLFDLQLGTWDVDALAEVEFSAEAMPRVLEPTAIGGYVSASASSETLLRQGTPVIVGSGDWMATLIGTGAALPERACIYLGTAGALGAFDSMNELEQLANPRCYAAATSAGSSLEWISRLLDSGDGQSLAEWQKLAAESPAGARGLMFFPHLLGERGGGLRPEARGALLGITLAHGRADVVRAVLEGTALWLRQLFEPHLAKLDGALLVASGGGANSLLWVEIVASILDREIGLLSTSNGGLRGMAMLATVALNIDSDLGSVSRRWTAVQATVKPNSDLVTRYGPIARRFAEAEALLSQMEMWDQENKGG